MLKYLFTIAISLILISPDARCDEAAASADFTSALREAITEKDIQKIDALTFSEGASPEDKKRTSQMQEMMLMRGKDIDIISLEPLPSDFESLIVMNGQKIEPTAPPVGMVKITYKKAEQGLGNSTLAYSVVGGKFFLVGMKSTALAWKGPPDRNIGYSIVGLGVSNLKIHGAWNASGVPLKKEFKQSNTTFWGQHFEELTVTSENEECDATVTIQEDGKTIYTQPLKGKTSLQYKKR